MYRQCLLILTDAVDFRYTALDQTHDSRRDFHLSERVTDGNLSAFYSCHYLLYLRNVMEKGTPLMAASG
jgi:hypothetical protein